MLNSEGKDVLRDVAFELVDLNDGKTEVSRFLNFWGIQCGFLLTSTIGFGQAQLWPCKIITSDLLQTASFIKPVKATSFAAATFLHHQ